ncbi:hypothetical protein [Sabulicella rubraurantiaca]|uniref:hypothetical protein n=1 Tax=Sabulicella rubraurantiaca TaxID=2811429 RepID=UPI001A963E59|nr:hypothetical protein [Sabulicella rubraurantiaca]
MKDETFSAQSDRPRRKSSAPRVAAHRKRKERALAQAQGGLLEAARVIAELLIRIGPENVPLVIDARLAELVEEALQRCARGSDPAEQDLARSVHKAFLIKRINGAALPFSG